MRNLHLTLAMALGILSLTTGLSATPQLGVLRVTITGIQDPVGTMRLSLDDSADTFLGKAKPDFRIGNVLADANQVIYEFTDIPFGVYAIKLFQDQNDNEKLDTNLLGIPSEPYGISNDARGMFGLPSFKESSFEHSQQVTALTIHVKPHLTTSSH